MLKKRKKKPMKKRRWFTASELVEMWDRWQRGESLKGIGRMLDRNGSAIHHGNALEHNVTWRDLTLDFSGAGE